MAEDIKHKTSEYKTMEARAKEIRNKAAKIEAKLPRDSYATTIVDI